MSNGPDDGPHGKERWQATAHTNATNQFENHDQTTGSAELNGSLYA